MDFVLILATIAATCCFALVNGLTDSPHSFAPPVRTGALRPRIAVLFTAFITGIGALVASGLAQSVVSRVSIPDGPAGLLILLAGAASAAAWGIAAHCLKKPTSSTHALAGGLLGASMGAALIGRPSVGTSDGFLVAVFLLPLLLTPCIAYALALGVSTAVIRARSEKSAHRVNKNSRITQSIVSSIFALAHGIQDGQRTVFMFLAILMGAGVAITPTAHMAVVVASAALLAAGAALGSWRIGWTLTHRMTRLDPLTASVGSGTAAFLLLLGAMGLSLPLSSTQLSTSALLGAAEATPFKPTRWHAVLRIALFWLLTPLAAAAGGCFLYLAMSSLV